MVSERKIVIDLDWWRTDCAAAVLMKSPRVYDAVVFGATGFTGQRVLRELVSHSRG